ncbi:MAG: hypothetical protein R3335_13590 [Anaerolineales bacterium]|nr:hypothetical protein [Anaerolineales bacterium]
MISRHLTLFRLPGRVLAKALLLSLLMFGLVFTASAKGPMSATISGPGIDAPVELVDTTSPDLLFKLMEQSGIWYGTGDLPRPIEAPAGELGPAYTLTWVNSGPPNESVEARTIRQLIYLQAEGGALIYTPVQDSLKNWGAGVTGWFAAPAGLPATMAALGVPLPAAPPSTSFSIPTFGPGVYAAFGVAGLVLIALLSARLRTRRLVR